MVTKVQPGRAALERMKMYRLLADLAPLRLSYARKFALAAFVGVVIPLGIFVLYLLVSHTDLRTMYPVIAALVLACFAGFLGTMWIVRELLMPIELTAETLRNYIDSR